MPIENLRVEITGEAGDLTAELAEVRAGLAGLEQGLNSAEDSTEELGDALTGLSVRATTAAGGLSSLSAASAGTSASLTGVRQSLRNVEAIVKVLSVGALPSLASALGGVIAAGSGLAVGGALTTGLAAAATGAEDLQRSLSRARKQIVAVAGVAGQDLGLGGLLTGALETAPRVLAETLARVGGDLRVIAGAMREFGAAAANALPGVVSALTDLAVESLPVLRDGMEWLQSNGPQIFRTLVRSARELGPPLIDLGLATADIVGTLVDFSTTVTKAVAPALTTFLRLIDPVIKAQDALNEALLGFFRAPLESLDQALRNFTQAGVAMGTALANGVISVFNRLVTERLNEQILQVADRLPGLSRGDVATFSRLERFSPTRVPGAQLNRSDPGVTGATAPSRDDDTFAKMLKAIRNVEVNTEESASQAGKTASATGRLADTMASSALMSRDRCSLAQALVPPLQRVPRRAASRATAAERQAVGANRRPRRPALDPGEGTSGTDKQPVIEVDGMRLGEITYKQQQEYKSSFIVK